MREAKLLMFFSTKKNISIFEILSFEILTKRQLTTSLVLNNWAQISKFQKGRHMRYHEKHRIAFVEGLYAT